jgi:hypothetical protein
MRISTGHASENKGDLPDKGALHIEFECGCSAQKPAKEARVHVS